MTGTLLLLDRAGWVALLALAAHSSVAVILLVAALAGQGNHVPE